MINRLKILAKIDDLTDEHCTTCEIDRTKSNKYCYTKCNIGEQLRGYGDLLLGKHKNKVDDILAKGENVTTKDVKYLLNQGLTRVKIAKSIGITQGNVKKWFDELEGKTIGGLDMSKPKSNYEKVEVMVKNGENIDVEKVAKELGVSKATVYNYANKARNGNVRKVESTDTSKLERENKALKAELAAVEEDYKEHQAKARLQVNSLDKDKYDLQKDMKAIEGECEQLETVIENLEQMNKQEKELTKQTIQKYNEIEKRNIELEAELKQLQEESKRKDTEITLYKQESQWAKKEYNESERRVLGLQVRNDELRAEAEKQIDRLQAELDAERAKHEHLSSYARILMKKEGVANA